MAAFYTYLCSQCRFKIIACDDGNPYILDDNGTKHFCCHPGEMDTIMEVVQASSVGRTLSGEALESFIQSRRGNLGEFLCLDCGRRFKAETERAPRPPVCTRCGSTNVCSSVEIDGRTCPKCRQGIFREDPMERAIS